MNLTTITNPYKQSTSLLDVILKNVDSQTVLGGIRCGWMQYDNDNFWARENGSSNIKKRLTLT